MSAASRPAISLAVLLLGLLGLAATASAQVATQRQPAAAATARPGGPAWASLSAAQQQALAPLQRDWPSIDASRKAKWLEIASRFPQMPAGERARVQQRMADWSKLSPNERAEARIQFQQARQFAPDDRQARWDAYQALPEEARRDLARRAANPLAAIANGASGANGAMGPSGPSAAKSTPRLAGATPPSTKQNVVEPPKAVTPKLVTPTIVQSKPGATTTLLSQPANPPMHQQSGLPKIAATKEFVQPNTLLPKRGPQGAAVRSAAAASGIPVQ